MSSGRWNGFRRGTTRSRSCAASSGLTARTCGPISPSASKSGEKGTIGGILSPVLDEYGVTFRVMKGFGSATSVHGAAEESQNRSFTVLYVGDYDPSGLHMSAIDLPARLERYGAEIDIIRIALIEGDLAALPSFDADTKKKDPRHEWFTENYGRRCWELDAMNPVDLRSRVRVAVETFIDEDAWELSRKAEAAEIATIDAVCANWRKLVSGEPPAPLTDLTPR